MAEVKGVMTENIDRMLQRGEKLELLTDKTENLMSEVRGKEGGQHLGGSLHSPGLVWEPHDLLMLSVLQPPCAGRSLPADWKSSAAALLVAELQDEASGGRGGAAGGGRHLPARVLLQEQLPETVLIAIKL